MTPPASPPLPPPANNARRTSPSRASSQSPPQIRRSSPPAHIGIPRASPPSHKSQPQPQPHTPPRPTYLGVDVEGHGGWGGEGEATPGSWSTAATPGTGQGSVEWEQPSPTRALNGQELKDDPKLITGSESGGSGSVLKKAWVSEELDAHAANQHIVNSGISLDTIDSTGTSESDGSKRPVRVTPSVGGVKSSDGATPQLSPVQDYLGVSAGWPVDPSIPISYGVLPPHPPSQGNAFVDDTVFPPGFAPDASEWTASAPPLPIISAPSPPRQPSNIYYSPQPSQPPYISAPQPVHGQHVQNIYTSTPPVEFELTPSIIAKAQKHSRFAISALDYEDAAQARKELRAALAALGG